MMTTEPVAADPPYPRRYEFDSSSWIVLPEPVDGPVVRLGGAELDEQDLQACSTVETWDAEARTWRPVD